jgi:hypothetical protein
LAYIGLSAHWNFGLGEKNIVAEFCLVILFLGILSLLLLRKTNSTRRKMEDPKKNRISDNKKKKRRSTPTRVCAIISHLIF